MIEADAGRHFLERNYAQVASKTGVCVSMVITVLKEFLQSGFTEMIKPRRNPASDTVWLKVTGDIEAKIIALTCSCVPDGRARWTINLLCDHPEVVLDDRTINRATVARVLSENELRPHLNEYWCIPPREDADFVASMEDILDVYQQPYDPEYQLLCMDEKPYQIHGEGGAPARIDSEYIRNGTASIFCFIQPHTGRICHAIEPTRTAVDLAEKIKYLVDVIEPDAKKIILVMDNLNTHSIALLYKAFPPEEAQRIARRLEVHHTPKHGSCLDIAEIGINIITRECLDRRIPSIEALRSELKAWNDEYDRLPSPINWQFRTKDARIKLKSLYPDIQRNRKERNERCQAKSS